MTELEKARFRMLLAMGVPLQWRYVDKTTWIPVPPSGWMDNEKELLSTNWEFRPVPQTLG